ncbi:MAG TPA: ABC transporter ATP-binding protein [Pseudolabrys sp.]|jgi:ATP-binding cassette subfamily C protein|nr:ABC transporter ATP-binding protein [Pseudolabrys sp.]
MQARLFLRDVACFAGRRGVWTALLMALGGLFEGLSLAMIVPLLGIVTGAGAPFGRLERAAATLFAGAGVETPVGKLAVLLGIFGLMMIARGAIVALRDRTVTELQTGFVEAQRLRIAEALAAARWDQVAGLRHARITHLMSGDIQRIGAAANLLLRVAVAVVMLIAQCALVFLLAPQLAAIAFVLLALTGFIFVTTIGGAHRSGVVVTQANLSLLNSTTQFLGGLKLAKSQNMEQGFLAEFRQTLHDLSRRQIDFMRQQSRTRLAFSTVSALAAGGLVLVGFGAFHVAPPTLIALLLVIGRMSGPALQLQQGAQQFANVLPAYRAVKDLEQDLASIAPEHSGVADAAHVPEGAIVFTQVSFAHAVEDDDGAARGVRDVSVSIAPGDFIGIAGPSGAGKTTFADLLVGLFPPQQGHITVGGAALQGATLAAWRRAIAYVSQDAFLSHDTVRRNVCWMNPRASDSDIWAALAFAGADARVRRMEAGLETVVGERGTLVSGGERQRLALVRAILRKPRVLVLDEATSAIDVAGEQEIFVRLRNLTPRPTIVVIAHRAESLALCDRLLRFEAGRCQWVESPARPRGSGDAVLKV